VPCILLHSVLVHTTQACPSLRGRAVLPDCQHDSTADASAPPCPPSGPIPHPALPETECDPNSAPALPTPSTTSDSLPAPFGRRTSAEVTGDELYELVSVVTKNGNLTNTICGAKEVLFDLVNTSRCVVLVHRISVGSPIAATREFKVVLSILRDTDSTTRLWPQGTADRPKMIDLHSHSSCCCSSSRRFTRELSSKAMPTNYRGICFAGQNAHFLSTQADGHTSCPSNWRGRSP